MKSFLDKKCLYLRDMEPLMRFFQVKGNVVFFFFFFFLFFFFLISLRKTYVMVIVRSKRGASNG